MSIEKPNLPNAVTFSIQEWLIKFEFTTPQICTSRIMTKAATKSPNQTCKCNDAALTDIPHKKQVKVQFFQAFFLFPSFLREMGVLRNDSSNDKLALRYNSYKWYINNI